MSDFLATVVVGFGTYVFRAVFIVVLAKRRIPEVVLVALKYVGPAVLGALIVALLTDPRGQCPDRGPRGLSVHRRGFRRSSHPKPHLDPLRRDGGVLGGASPRLEGAKKILCTAGDA